VTMTLNEITENTLKTIKEISDNDSLIWSTVELNICSHLRERLQKYFPGYDVDVELEKIDRRRPDIIVHKRGGNKNNLVVFQVKKHPNESDVTDDLNKINQTFFNAPYNYKYGIFISVKELPKQLPDYDKSRIKLIQISGWKIYS
jgi:hypothetical protein